MQRGGRNSTPHSHREPGTPRAGSCGRRPRWQRVAARRKARPHARTLVSSLHSSPRFTRPRTRVLFSHSSLRALGSPCAVRGTRCVTGGRVRDPLPAARVRTRKPVPSVCCVPGTGAGTKLHKAKSPSPRSSRASQGDSKPTHEHAHTRAASTHGDAPVGDRARTSQAEPGAAKSNTRGHGLGCCSRGQLQVVASVLA